MARDPTLTTPPVGKTLEISEEDMEIQESAMQSFCGDAVAEFGAHRDALARLLQDSAGKKLSQRAVDEALWRLKTMAWALDKVWSNASVTPPLLEAAKQVNKGKRSTLNNPKHNAGRDVFGEWMKWMDAGQPRTKEYPRGLSSEFAKHWASEEMTQVSIQQNISRRDRWPAKRAEALRKRAAKSAP